MKLASFLTPPTASSYSSKSFLGRLALLFKEYAQGLLVLGSILSLAAVMAVVHSYFSG